jgi:hypothetical protein
MTPCSIKRVYLPTETLGSFYSPEGIMLCKTLELPWLNNRRSVSCIAEGSYEVIREFYTKKHPYPHFRLPNVEGRSGILIHKITYVSGLKGCIGVGQAFADLNKDGVPDMIRSGKALQELYDSMPDSFILNITFKAVTNTIL